MKKIFSVFVLLFCGVCFAGSGPPNKQFGQDLGKDAGRDLIMTCI